MMRSRMRAARASPPRRVDPPQDAELEQHVLRVDAGFERTGGRTRVEQRPIAPRKGS